jgi:hypothetical protein
MEVSTMTRTLKVTLTAFLITVFVGWSNPRVFSADEVFYAWEDASGNRYVTVQSQKAVNPETIYPNHPEIQFIAVDVKSPIRLRPGFQSHTYRFVKQVKTTYSLVDNNEKPVVFLIGETHLGESQEAVAKLACDLIKEYEIDAVLLEQPDHFKFDWSKYKSLEENPKQAIAALQQRMLGDASQRIAIELGKYKKYFDEGVETEEDWMRIQRRIYADFGEAGLKELIQILETQAPEVNSANESYDKSESISAFDYLYLMLNLQGIRIPFHNLESDELRKQFVFPSSTDQESINKALDARV